MIKILFFGDVVGQAGRKAVAQVLPLMRKKYEPDLVIANGENIAHGVGITAKTVGEMKAAGIDCLTTGNHVWAKRSEAIDLLPLDPPYVLRPHNYPAGNIGTGVRRFDVKGVSVLIINLQGRVFMHENIDCPFRALDVILAQEKADVVFVDFHAEATSEKIVFGRYADGRVSAVIGTHTHVPTADMMVLPKGTAYVTDAGMVGLKESSLGANLKEATDMFLKQIASKQLHDTPEEGLVSVDMILVDVDPTTGKALSIERIRQEVGV